MKTALVLVFALLLPACVPDERAPSGSFVASAAPAPPPAPKPAATSKELGLGEIQRPPVAPGPPTSQDPALTAEFKDGFERAAVGPDWTATSGAWRIDGGRLCGEHARNHPIWLRKRLPANARIEFDASSGSPDGDIKAEYWGDGRSAAETVSYSAATSYLTIFGGWKNSFHVLARIDEHAKNRPELRLDDSSDDLRARRVVKDRIYHFKVLRDDGKTVRWFVDDLEILTYPDPQPLKGAGHDHFGFNDWDVRLCFDNLVVVPLP